MREQARAEGRRRATTAAGATATRPRRRPACPGDPAAGAARGRDGGRGSGAGQVRVANIELDDMIILRSDGTPTFMHAVVVDDHDMAITHVIRGDDHLTNTFRQVHIYRAMGWEPPASPMSR